jgi:lipoprotein signal peptidase
MAEYNNGNAFSISDKKVALHKTLTICALCLIQGFDMLQREKKNTSALLELLFLQQAIKTRNTYV